MRLTCAEDAGQVSQLRHGLSVKRASSAGVCRSEAWAMGRVGGAWTCGAGHAGWQLGLTMLAATCVGRGNSELLGVQPDVSVQLCTKGP